MLFAGARRAGVGTGGSLGLGLLLVHRLAELHRCLGQRVGLRDDLIGIAAFDRGFGLGDRAFDFRLHLGRDLVAIFGELFLGRMYEALGIVLGLGRGAPLLVVLGELLGFLDHLLDVLVGEAARSLDADLLLLAGALVLGRHVDDAVGVDVEGNLDLRHPAWRRRDP